MKPGTTTSTLIAVVFLSTLNSQLSTASAQGTAFTYQGQLKSNGAPAQGVYDLRFELFIEPAGGTAAFGPVDRPATPVEDGRFTTLLDFGGTPFHGGDYWLGISVKTNGAATYQALTPRQLITPTPNAITAWSVLPDGLPAGLYQNALNLSNPLNQFAGDGSGLTGLNASLLNSGLLPDARLSTNVTRLGNSIEAGEITDGAGSGLDADLLDGFNSDAFAKANHDHNLWYWKVSGNAVGDLGGAPVLGTTDNQPLALHVNAQPALRLQPAANSPNLIGGYAGNIVSNGVYGAFIGGGGHLAARNRVGGNYASVLGGAGNTASGFASTAMGAVTTASGSISTAMGEYTVASGDSSTALGAYTTASGDSSTAMGRGTVASGRHSLAAGYYAEANHDGAFVWADDSQQIHFTSTAANQFSLRASGGVRLSDSTPSISFGATTRQMLDLYNQDYGVGVQTSTLYHRSNSRFSWFRGGVHSNNQNDPGAGGVVAMTLTSGGLTVNGALVSASDRNAKEDFKPVDAQAVLAKVVALPLSEWRYRDDEERSRHLGPMAQDFHAAFGVGPDDKHIATVDADGVALAAIQGLNQKLEERLREKDTQLIAQQQQLSELFDRLAVLEKKLNLSATE